MLCKVIEHSRRIGGIAPSAKPAEESYTARLLKAKQKVWEERQKEKDQNN